MEKGKEIKTLEYNSKINVSDIYKKLISSQIILLDYKSFSWIKRIYLLLSDNLFCWLGLIIANWFSGPLNPTPINQIISGIERDKKFDIFLREKKTNPILREFLSSTCKGLEKLNFTSFTLNSTITNIPYRPKDLDNSYFNIALITCKGVRRRDIIFSKILASFIEYSKSNLINLIIPLIIMNWYSLSFSPRRKGFPVWNMSEISLKILRGIFIDPVICFLFFQLPKNIICGTVNFVSIKFGSIDKTEKENNISIKKYIKLLISAFSTLINNAISFYSNSLVNSYIEKIIRGKKSIKYVLMPIAVINIISFIFFYYCTKNISERDIDEEF